MRTKQETIDYCEDEICRYAKLEKSGPHAYFDGAIAALIGVVCFLEGPDARDRRAIYLHCRKKNEDETTETTLVG